MQWHIQVRYLCFCSMPSLLHCLTCGMNEAMARGDGTGSGTWADWRYQLVIPVVLSLVIISPVTISAYLLTPEITTCSH